MKAMLRFDGVSSAGLRLFTAGANVSRGHSRDCNGSPRAVVTERQGSCAQCEYGAWERTTQTRADGSYSIPELPIGTYLVSVSQSGFQTSSVIGIVVDVAAERRVDASTCCARPAR
jgi:hypothetical protein